MSIVRNPDDEPTLESDSPVTEGDEQKPAPATSAADPFIGRQIGSYLVRAQIGKGGMGAVYLAEHPKIGSKVAIKFLHPKFVSDPRVVERFFNEARSVNLIGHPNILRIHDLDTTADGFHYCVMELLEGRSLQAFLRQRGKLTLSEALPIFEPICAALEAAHARGIVHRDLKPENIFLVEQAGQSTVKVVDFGIAKLADRAPDSLRTESGAVVGTPAYMSPEQATGDDAPIDARSDVYSLGIMLFQILTGRLPFHGPYGRMLVAHIQTAPPTLRSIEPSVPIAVEQVVLSALAKSPADRPQSASALLIALQTCASETGTPRRLGRPFSRRTSGNFSLRKTPPLDARTPEQRAAATPDPSQTARSDSEREQLFQAIPAPPHPWLTALRWLVILAVVGALSIRFLVPWVKTRLADASAPAAAQSAPPALPESTPNMQVSEVANPPPAKPQSAQEAKAQAAYQAAADSAVIEAAAFNKGPQGKRVPLFLVSEPLGASTVCSWRDGQADGVTPMKCLVPRGARVHIEAYALGFPASVKNVVAATSQAVLLTFAPAKPK